MSEKLYRVQMNSKGIPDFSTAVEVADRPKGEWTLDIYDSRGVNECSECCNKVIGYGVNIPFNYCPYCGADMRGADDE